MKRLLLRGFKPDPSICKVGNDYYMVTSSFEFFPSIPIFHSRDLIEWEQIGFCLDRLTQTNLNKVNNSQGMFAPTIRYHQGIFYLVCTNVGGGGNFLVTTKDPREGWSEPMWLNEWPGIDPSLYFEGDKAYIHGTRNWASSESAGIYLAEIDLATGKLLSERKNIWRGTGATDPEGPHIYKKDSWYYLLISEGGTEFGHMLTIARSKTIFGPYDAYEYNPFLTNRSLENPIQAVGHGDFVVNNCGEWSIVFLGFRCIGYPRQHNLGRETFSAPVLWGKDGWPKVSEKNNFQLYESVETMLNDQLDYEIIDHFSGKKLAPYWQYLRSPKFENYQVKNNQLHLIATEATLNTSENISFLSVPQTEYNFYAEASLDLTNILQVETGLTIYVRDNFHYDLFLKIKNSKRIICLRKKIGKLHQVEEIKDYQDDEITLFVSGTTENYIFGYRDKNDDNHHLFEGETMLLATEVTGGFTGTMIGIYATSLNEALINKSKFNHFLYQTGDKIK